MSSKDLAARTESDSDTTVTPANTVADRPDAALVSALLKMQLQLANLSLVRGIRDRRKEFWQFQLDSANALAKAGLVTDSEPFASFRAPPREITPDVKFVLGSFASVRRLCAEAAEALRRGGAAALDAAPGATASSFQLAKKVGALDTVCSRLEVGLHALEAVIDHDVAELEEVVKWLDDASEELRLALDWSMTKKPDESAGGAALLESAKGPSVGPTQKELLASTKASNAMAISSTVFRELVNGSGIRRSKNGEKGRRFFPTEVRALIDTAKRLGKQDWERIARSWERFAVTKKPTESPRAHGKPT